MGTGAQPGTLTDFGRAWQPHPLHAWSTLHRSAPGPLAPPGDWQAAGYSRA